MATVEMVMPRMGESIMEGTILKWLKQEGDFIEMDESVLEVATDKVDTEVPATHSGTLKKILAQEGEVVQIGNPIAIIAQEKEENETATEEKAAKSASKKTAEASAGSHEQQTASIPAAETGRTAVTESTTGSTAKPSVEPSAKPSTASRFYSPLVTNIAKKEGISLHELEQIEGTGKEGRVTKRDMLNYLESPEFKNKRNGGQAATTMPSEFAVHAGEQDEVVEMNRMRRMIATRMVESKRISAHVTSFVETDVTNLVLWRNRMKDEYNKREQEKFTLTPIFIEAVAQALKDYPMVNVSVKDNQIIRRKNINIGMAVALPDGNLIVPVIRNADQLSLLGLSKKVNELAEKARKNQLTADELSDGTYTVSNIGSFGNIMGTPIIVQPQVAILALGAIVKKPSVVETPAGDAIAIRHKMYLSHSYDHRVVDGALGGLFVKRVSDLLETFDTNRTI